MRSGDGLVEINCVMRLRHRPSIWLAISHASVVSIDFDQAASYALESLKATEIKLKTVKVKATSHDYRLWQEYLLPFMFDYRKAGSCQLRWQPSPCDIAVN